jgi:hypothetical protein
MRFITYLGRTLLLVVVSVICVGGFGGKVYAQASYWKKEVTRDKWGDVSGEVYTQTVRGEGREEMYGEQKNWALSIIVYPNAGGGIHIAGIGEYGQSPCSFCAEGINNQVSILLKDESGSTQNFIGTYIPASSNSKEVTIGCRDINFVQALKRNAKYKIWVGVEGSSITWYVRADVRGGLLTESNQTPPAPTSQPPAPSTQPSGSSGGSNAMDYVKRGNEYLDRGDKVNNNKDGTLTVSGKSDFDLAIAEFDRAIQLDPNIAAAHFGRGRGYLRKGDNSRAVASYSEAIRLNPNDAISYSNRGRAYARMGDYDNAVADFESAYRIDPKNAIIKQNLEKARRREKGL